MLTLSRFSLTTVTTRFMPAQSGTPTHRGRRITAAVVLALLAAAACWRWGGALAGREDPRIAEIRMMHEELAAGFPPGQPMRSPDEAVTRVAAMQAVMEKVQALPPELRGPAMMSGGRTFRASIDAKIDEYFALSSPHRTAFLDVEIDQMELMRSAFDAAGGGPGPAGGTGADRRTPFPPPHLSEQEAATMRKHMIDGTPPERRARMEEFFGAMQTRRRERGLPDLPEPP